MNARPTIERIMFWAQREVTMRASYKINACFIPFAAGNFNLYLILFDIYELLTTFDGRFIVYQISITKLMFRYQIYQ